MRQTLNKIRQSAFPALQKKGGLEIKEDRLGAGLKVGGSLLNRIGNPFVIPKPLICIEPENMNGFEELFFPL